MAIEIMLWFFVLFWWYHVFSFKFSPSSFLLLPATMALPGKVLRKVKFAEDNLCGDEPALTTASLKPPGTWSISKEELLSARNTRSRSPRRSSKTTELLQSPLKTVGQSRLLRLARMGRQQAAKLRDKSNIAALQASVAAGPKVIVVEKVVEVVKIIEALTLTNPNQV